MYHVILVAQRTLATTCKGLGGVAEETSNDVKSELEAEVISDFRLFFRVPPLCHYRYFTGTAFSDGFQTTKFLSETMKSPSLVKVDISGMLQLKKGKAPDCQWHVVHGCAQTTLHHASSSRLGLPPY